MNRDMDLVRKLLLKITDYSMLAQVQFPIPIEGYDPNQVEYHMVLMDEAGLITYERFGRDSCRIRLTWIGHEFLDQARNDTVWKKATAMAQEAGGVSLEILKQVLPIVIMEFVKAKMALGQ